MRKTLVATMLFIMICFAAPVWAGEFYIVRDQAMQKCMVVDKRPITNTRTISLADDTIYGSRAEAEMGMKGIKVCIGAEIKR